MKRTFFLIFCVIIALHAHSFQIDRALSSLEKKLDLSQKTREKNSGITYVFTRRKIELLGIRKIRDLLKRTPVGFHRSRYGVVDPFGPSTSMAPLMSTPIKLFIDDVEIFSGNYNNGLSIMDDMDIGFVDHVEIYIQNPSLKIIQEPAFVVIKLYSKRSTRESLMDIKTALDMRGDRFFDGSIARDGLYLFGSIDNEDNGYLKRHHLQNAQKTLFASYRIDRRQDLHLIVHSVDNGGFLGPALTDFADRSSIKNKFFQLSYRYVKNDEIFQAAFDYFDNETFYYKEPFLSFLGHRPFRSMDVKSEEKIGDFLYQNSYKRGKNELTYGLKYRYKHFIYPRANVDTTRVPMEVTRQQITSLFLHDDYMLSDSFIINIGGMKSRVDNNRVIDYHPKLYRFGLTKLFGDLSLQLQYSHMEVYPDPYMLHKRSLSIARYPLDMVKVDNTLLYLSYENENSEYKFGVGYFTSPNYIMPNRSGRLDNVDQRMFEHYLSLGYGYEYRPFCKISLDYFGQRIRHIPLFKRYMLHRLVLDHFQQVGRWQFSQSLVYTHMGPPTHMKEGVDLDLFGSFEIGEHLNFFVKGENILDKAFKYSYPLLDPRNPSTFTSMDIRPIDRKIWIGLEWNF